MNEQKETPEETTGAHYLLRARFQDWQAWPWACTLRQTVDGLDFLNRFPPRLVCKAIAFCERWGGVVTVWPYDSFEEIDAANREAGIS